MELELRSRDGALTVEGLPIEIMENILSYLSYDEISIYRRVNRYFNTCCQRLLNQGFFRAERFHAQCLKAVKKQLPRRESERRTHPLARHCEILTSIETRLSLLSMTFMKYMEMSLCCFIPGKVIDEIFRVLRLVQGAGGQGCTGTPPRAHEILQELRDISSMAMEHFDERIAPGLKLHVGPLKPALGFLGTAGHHCGSSTAVARSSELATATSILGRVQKPCVHTAVHASLTEELKQLRSSNLSLRKTLAECKSKLTTQTKKLRDQEKQLNDQSQLVTEQGSRLAEQEGKLTEMNRKLLEQHREFADVLEEVSRLREAVTSGNSNDGELGSANSGNHPAEKAAPRSRSGPKGNNASSKRQHSDAALTGAEAGRKRMCSGSKEKTGEAAAAAQRPRRAARVQPSRLVKR
ncbi:hypothetical protein HPB48_012925 [Haemaphysalis longicornis]|uniref:F-box domain-containing protein n=1 Tax=Haemaphysalis longicornis TaxID=44386 RepID=A0A9J6GLV4_HAELO|nr:hypothetical protein HPB48_012925 [Haemaphysalis longicornis]